MRNYGSLKWRNTNNQYSLWVNHPDRMNFNTHRGNNKYNVFATMEGYDLDISPNIQPNLYGVWVTKTDFSK